MRYEVLVLGQEEERVHLALHRGVRNVEALLGDRSELPVADGFARLQVSSSSGISCRSFQLCQGHRGHVVVFLVFAGHAPDEGVGTGAGAHMDRPGGREHGVAVGDDQMARFFRVGPSGG